MKYHVRSSCQENSESIGEFRRVAGFTGSAFRMPIHLICSIQGMAATFLNPVGNQCLNPFPAIVALMLVAPLQQTPSQRVQPTKDVLNAFLNFHSSSFLEGPRNRLPQSRYLIRSRLWSNQSASVTTRTSVIFRSKYRSGLSVLPSPPPLFQSAPARASDPRSLHAGEPESVFYRDWLRKNPR